MDKYVPYLVLLILVVMILIALTVINIIQNIKLKRTYEGFMMGRDCRSLEDNLIKRVNQIDELIRLSKKNQENIQRIVSNLNITYQKMGMVKYDAFKEMGGKLSFSLALLNRKNDGFIINAMHSREGCFTYVKEIIDGNPLVLLSEEEREALDQALGKK